MLKWFNILENSVLRFFHEGDLGLLSRFPAISPETAPIFFLLIRGSI